MELFKERYYNALEELYLASVDEAKKEIFLGTNNYSPVLLLFTDFGLWLNNDKGIQAHNVICNYFDIVRIMYFDKFSKITSTNLVEMLFYMAGRNLDNGILSDNKRYLGLPDSRDSAEVKQAIVKELFDFEKREFDKMATILDMSLRKVKKKENAIYYLKYFDSGKINEYKEAHTLIKEHYFDKIDSFSFDDIEEIVKAFEKLNNKFRSEKERELMLSFIRQYLEKQINLRKVVVNVLEDNSEVIDTKKEVPTKEVNVVPLELKPKKVNTGINKKEFFEIKKCIESVFDFEKNAIKDNINISYDDISKYNELMVKAGYSEVERLRFVKATYVSLTNNFNHPYVMLSNIKNKLDFYGITGSEIDETMTNIKQFLPEYMALKVEITSRQGNDKSNINKELKDWEDIIRTEFGKLLSYVPKSGEYEQAEIKKLMNTK